MNPLTLIGVVALFFLFAVAWHDESARDSNIEQRAAETDRNREMRVRQETSRPHAICTQSDKRRNA